MTPALGELGWSEKGERVSGNSSQKWKGKEKTSLYGRQVRKGAFSEWSLYTGICNLETARASKRHTPFFQTSF